MLTDKQPKSASRVGIITIDEKGLICSFDSISESLFGYKESELLNINVSVLMAEPDVSHHDEYLERYKAKATPRVIGQGREVIGKRKDASCFPIWLAVNEIFFEGKRLFIGSLMDLTDQKRVESNLAKSLEMTNAILTTAVNPIITINRTGLVQSFNPAAERLFQYEQEEVLGKNINMLMPEPYHSEHDGYLSSYLTSGNPKVIGQGREVEGKKKNGKVFPMHLSVGEMEVADEKMFVGIIADVSELKEAEKELAANVEVTQAILKTAVNPIITIDELGYVHSFNPAAEQLFGYQQNKVIGNNVNMLMPAPYHAEHDGYLSRYLQEGNPKVIGQGREVEGQKSDGSIFPMHLTVGETSLSGRRMFVGIVSDLTDIKANEKELARTAEITRAILDTAVNPIITIDENGVVHSFNPAAKTLFGFEQDSVLGNNVNMLMPEPYHAEHDNYLSRYLKDGDPKVIGQGREVEGKKSDGSTFPMHLTVGEMHLSGRRMFVGIVSDMTEIKKNERELRKHQDHLEELVSIATQEVSTIIQTAVSGVLTINGDGIIRVFNPAAEQLFGWEKDEIIGKNIALLLTDDSFNENDRGSEGDGLKQRFDLVSTKTVGTGTEVTAVRKDGSTFPASIAIGHSQINQDQHYYVAFISDITVQRETENALKRAKEAAEAGGRAKSAFLANMSHEIRTPMNAIMGFAEVVLCEETLDPETKSHVEIIFKSAKSLLSIINDILDVSKLESGNFNIEQVCFHLPNAITEALQSIEHLFFEKALTLDIKYHDNLPTRVLGDPTRIRQVLLNIVGNGVKFTEKGGVVISVSPGMDADTILFRVKDTGIGMNEEQQEQVFLSFSQADDSTTRRFGGTGLGTTISKQLVEKMGGTIWVESEIDVGSEFYFTVCLPEAIDYSHCLFEDSEQLIEDCFSPRLFKILLAEDLEQNAMLAQIRLKDQGHQVEWAKNGKQVLEMLTHNTYDLILMDVMMPEMDGIEATTAVRELELGTDEHITIVALTASVMKEDHDKCIAAGMDAVESKPVQFKSLLNTLECCVPDGKGRVNERSNTGKSVSRIFNWQPMASVANVNKALLTWLEEKVYFDALLKFSEQRLDDADKILLAIEQNNLVEAKSIAHGLKGVASNMALSEIAKLATDLDYCIRTERCNDIQDKIKKLRSALFDACGAITKLKNNNIQQEDSADKLQFDAAKVCTLLNQLVIDATSLNPDILEPTLNSLKRYMEKAKIKPLLDAVDEFDFDKAEEVAKLLVKEFEQSQETSDE